MTDTRELIAELRAFEGRAVGPSQAAPDPVNQAMIHHWCQAVGDSNPVYHDPRVAAASSRPAAPATAPIPGRLVATSLPAVTRSSTSS